MAATYVRTPVPRSWEPTDEVTEPSGSMRQVSAIQNSASSHTSPGFAS